MAINPMAKDLRTPKYKMKVKKNKKKYNRKPVTDPFKELVLAINNRTVYPDSMGKSQVKGKDVAGMRDYLNGQGSKDA
tara:strand:- start:721 stop:954 length:234 start_codon:yes stop_codon:yes gene_type:complete